MNFLFFNTVNHLQRSSRIVELLSNRAMLDKYRPGSLVWRAEPRHPGSSFGLDIFHSVRKKPQLCCTKLEDISIYFVKIANIIYYKHMRNIDLVKLLLDLGKSFDLGNKQFKRKIESIRTSKDHLDTVTDLLNSYKEKSQT